MYGWDYAPREVHRLNAILRQLNEHHRANDWTTAPGPLWDYEMELPLGVAVHRPDGRSMALVYFIGQGYYVGYLAPNYALAKLWARNLSGHLIDAGGLGLEDVERPDEIEPRAWPTPDRVLTTFRPERLAEILTLFSQLSGGGIDEKQDYGPRGGGRNADRELIPVSQFH